MGKINYMNLIFKLYNVMKIFRSVFDECLKRRRDLAELRMQDRNQSHFLTGTYLMRRTHVHLALRLYRHLCKSVVGYI